MTTDQFEVSATRRQHFVALDSVRGIAALFVVILHFETTPIVRGIFGCATLMVDLFFVLSGFAIYYAYQNRLQNTLQLRRFVWLRFWRLYPMHFVMLMYFVALELAKPFAGLFVPIHHAAFSLGGWKDILANLLLLQSFNLTKSVSFNSPSWSISAEFYIYMLFAALAFLLFRRAGIIWASLLICVTAIATLAFLDPSMDWTFDYGWVRGLAGFFAGVLTVPVYQTLRLRAKPSFDIGIVGLSALAILVAFVLFKPTGRYVNLGIIPLSAIMILIIALSPQYGAIRILCSAPARWLGRISYSIYMVHLAVGFALGYFVKILVPGGYGLPAQVSLAVLNIAVVVAVASAISLLIEMPIRAWSRTRVAH